MTQKLRWATLTEDPTWVESTHGNSLRTAWNSTFRRSDTSGLCGHLHTYVHPPPHTHIHMHTLIGKMGRDRSVEVGGGHKRVMKVVNMIKIYYVHGRECHNESHHPA